VTFEKLDRGKVRRRMHRVRMMHIFLLSTLVLIASNPVQSAPVSDAVILAERFVQAWNAHTPEIFTVALDPDADWITARGERLHGRTEIQSYLGREHSTWAKETQMSQLGIESRLLSQEVAIVALSWRITRGVRDDEVAFRGVTQFIAKKTGSGWIVVSGQVTSSRTNEPVARAPVGDDIHRSHAMGVDGRNPNP
jgi:uncharacterized protein (TIGR02246 family)